jgi:hypothetical protein
LNFRISLEHQNQIKIKIFLVRKERKGRKENRIRSFASLLFASLRVFRVLRGPTALSSSSSPLWRDGGAHDRNRTCDLFLTKEVLYRLSYVSVNLLPRGEFMERETGIEPAPSAWKAEVLPLNYSREGGVLWRSECSVALPMDECWWEEVDYSSRPAELLFK